MIEFKFHGLYIQIDGIKICLVGTGLIMKRCARVRSGDRSREEEEPGPRPRREVWWGQRYGPRIETSRLLDSRVSAYPPCYYTSRIMSSYQFVNSLASCYGGQGGGRSPVEPQSPEYYGAAAPGYGCYSPQGYAGYVQQPPVVEYAQLGSHQALAQAGPRIGQLGPVQVQQPSCKFEGLGSPQDLSTQPARTASPAGLASPRAGPAPSQASSSPASTASTSSQPAASTPAPPQQAQQNNNNNSTSANSKSSQQNPPQIYPWMKRVHLGQSKFLLIYILRFKF